MIIANSRYALVGYFITSYPTRAHGIILFQIFFLIATIGRLLVALATLSKSFTGAMAMAYLTSKWLNAVNQTDIQRGPGAAITRMYVGPLTRKDSAGVQMITL